MNITHFVDADLLVGHGDHLIMSPIIAGVPRPGELWLVETTNYSNEIVVQHLTRTNTGPAAEIFYRKRILGVWSALALSSMSRTPQTANHDTGHGLFVTRNTALAYVPAATVTVTGYDAPQLAPTAPGMSFVPATGVLTVVGTHLVTVSVAFTPTVAPVANATMTLGLSVGPAAVPSKILAMAGAICASAHALVPPGAVSANFASTVAGSAMFKLSSVRVA